MKILLVDDHVVVREGVRRLFSVLPDTDVYGAETSEEALNVFRTLKPDLVILDINLAGISGINLLRRMIAEDPRTKALMLSMEVEPIHALRALQAGACGYLSKGAPVEELLLAVSSVARGQRYVDKEIATELVSREFTSYSDLIQRLTAREKDILRLLGEGRSATQIATSLGISYKTVANSCSAMKSKFAVERSADLVRVALELREP
ncbi:MAG: response regulator transcription factor [Proteobacteria bacterium]|nr:response regulator transcription factor [Pseudomonadota bacterium]